MKENSTPISQFVCFNSMVLLFLRELNKYRKLGQCDFDNDHFQILGAGSLA